MLKFADLEGYQKRMLFEYKELLDRMDKMENFIYHSEEYKKLPYEKSRFVNDQYSAMVNYRIALLNRIFLEDELNKALKDEDGINGDFFEVLLDEVPTFNDVLSNVGTELQKSMNDNEPKKYVSPLFPNDPDDPQTTLYKSGYCDGLEDAMFKICKNKNEFNNKIS